MLRRSVIDVCNLVIGGVRHLFLRSKFQGRMQQFYNDETHLQRLCFLNSIRPKGYAQPTLSSLLCSFPLCCTHLESLKLQDSGKSAYACTNALSLICLVGVRMVTSSSALLGCTPTTVSIIFFETPIFTATAKPCTSCFTCQGEKGPGIAASSQNMARIPAQ